jgi:molybdopterin converting factor small subunit
MESEAASPTPTTRVLIPGNLRKFAGGLEEIWAAGQTVTEVLQDLYRQCPELRDLLLDGQGVRRFVNLYVGEDDIRFLKGLDTKLGAGNTLTILSGIAGG